jgi:hypothetical protein
LRADMYINMLESGSIECYSEDFGALRCSPIQFCSRADGLFHFRFSWLRFTAMFLALSLWSLAWWGGFAFLGYVLLMRFACLSICWKESFSSCNLLHGCSVPSMISSPLGWELTIS